MTLLIGPVAWSTASAVAAVRSALQALSEVDESRPHVLAGRLRIATVAAGVFLIGASLIMPALRQSRDTSRRIACQNNLRTLGTALFDYAQLNAGNIDFLKLR